MKKLLFLLIFVVSSAFAHHVTGNKKIMIAYAEQWPPYSYRDENGKMKGILIDLMNKLLHTGLHVDLEHEGFPWKQAQVLAEQGIYDAVITFPSDDRKKKYVANEETLLDIEWRGFTSVHSKNFELVSKAEDPLSLDNKLNYCVVLGDKTTEKLLSNTNITPHQSKNVSTAVKMLYDGRTDFFVNAKLTTLNLIYKNKLQNVVKLHPKVYQKSPFHFLLSNNSNIPKKVVEKLDEHIRKLKKEKVYQNMLDKIESDEFHHWITK